MIKNFLVPIPEKQKYVERFKIIPEEWEKKILIVDDYKPFVDLLSALLGEEGAIDTANNGTEGLSKLGTTYYDAVISDVDMPSLDGISFYKEAHKNEPDIRERFIFLTGSTDDNKQAFIKENNLHYLKKPIGLVVLQKVVHDILSSTKPRA
jgi:CheY-like chemotaxis protein